MAVKVVNIKDGKAERDRDAEKAAARRRGNVFLFPQAAGGEGGSIMGGETERLMRDADRLAEGVF